MRIGLIILTVISCLWNANGQKFLVHEYNKFNLLPSENVRMSLRDSSGFLWVATTEGLFRFDGKWFKDFNNDIQGLDIRHIIQLNSNEFLISNDEGILKIRLDGPEVTTEILIPTSEMESDSLLYYPNTIYLDNAESLWISQPNSKIARWSDNQLKSYSFDPKTSNGSSKSRFSFLELDNGELWVASQTGYLFIYNQEEDRFDEVLLRPKPTSIESIKRIDNSVFILGDGIYVFRIEDNNIDKRYRFLSTDEMTCSDLIKDNYGRYFASTLNSGLFRIRIRRRAIDFQPVYKANDPHRVDRLPFSAIQHILFDRDNNIWLSTSAGLGLLQSRYFETVEGLPNDNTTSILSVLGDLHYVDMGEVFEVIQENEDFKAQPYSLAQGFNIASLAMGQGRIWTGTSDGRLIGYSAGGISKNLDLSERGGGVFHLYTDNKDQIWVCQAPSDKPIVGVSRLDLNGRLKEYGIEQGLKDRILVLKESSRDELYAAGIGHSSFLYRYDELKDEFINLSLPLNFPIDLNFEVHDMSIDDRGVVWLATTNGLIRYDLERYDRIDLGPYTDAEFRSVVSFSEDNYWLSTDAYGLIHYDGNEYVRFDENSGLPAKIMSYRSLEKDEEGRLWVGTTEGVVYSASSEPVPRFSKTPSITSLFVDGDIRSLDTDSIFQFTSSRLTEIQFVALAFPGQQIEYRYKLDLPDEDWNLLGTNNTLTLEDIPHGDYHLLLQSKEGEEFDWSPSKRLRLRVLKPWYKTLGFKIFMALLGLGLIAFLVRIRSLQAVRRLRKLEKQLAVTREKYSSARKTLLLDEHRLDAIMEVAELSDQNITNKMLFKNLMDIFRGFFDVDIIEIGIQDPKDLSIHIQGFIRQFDRHTLRVEPFNPKTSLASWIIHNQQEVMINNFDKAWERYINEPGYDKEFKSQILIPFETRSNNHAVLIPTRIVSVSAD